MLLELQRQAEDAFSLSQIEDYPGDLKDLLPILRHVCYGCYCNPYIPWSISDDCGLFS